MMKKDQLFVPTLLLISGLLLAACSPVSNKTGATTDPVKDLSSTTMKSVDEELMAESMAEEKGDNMAVAGENMNGYSDDAMIEKGDDQMTNEEEMSDDSMKKDEMESIAEEETMTPDWFTTTLVEARTGETFTISDYRGKVVLVETLAMWCSNCFKQQGQVITLHELLSDRDDFISLGIDIDPNENLEALKSYINKNGFDWMYTVAPREVAREIGLLYGDQFLNPPSTPMLIIDRHGNTHPLPFGIKSAEMLFEALQPFLDSEL